MKNLTTKTENNLGFGATTRVTKSFTTLTPKGNTVTLSISRKTISVTANPHTTNFGYAVFYNGKDVSICHNMTTKEQLSYTMEFVDKYAGTRFLK